MVLRVDEQITEKKAQVQRLFRKRMEADQAYVQACKELAVLEAQRDEQDDRVIEAPHWHPPRYQELNWGEDS